MTDESTTYWMRRAQAGDDSMAQEQIVDRYLSRLIGLARGKLSGVPKNFADEEDVALSALKSFLVRAPNANWDLHDRHDLWTLLATITSRKVINLRQLINRKKRGSGKVGSDPEDLVQALSRDPTPDDATALVDECNRLLETLPNNRLRQIALKRLHGYSTTEIAEQLGCHKRSVERKVNRIQAHWKEISPEFFEGE